MSCTLLATTMITGTIMVIVMATATGIVMNTVMVTHMDTAMKKRK